MDDIRYRFFLFPLNFGLPEKEALKHHERMKGYWKEISRNQVALLKNAAPLLRVPRQNFDGGLPSRAAPGAAITFDPVWYAHEYIDAAMEISEGWFEDPLHHYLEVGRLRGYLPTCPVQEEVHVDLSLPNLATEQTGHAELPQQMVQRLYAGGRCRERRKRESVEGLRISYRAGAQPLVDGRPWE